MTPLTGQELHNFSDEYCRGSLTKGTTMGISISE